jgi:hypothetical protein
MLQSHTIEIDGHFVGSAVRLDLGYRFIAVDARLEDLDGTIWPGLSDVQRLARQLFLTGRFDRGPDQIAAGLQGSSVPSEPAIGSPRIPPSGCVPPWSTRVRHANRSFESRMRKSLSRG